MPVETLRPSALVTQGGWTGTLPGNVNDASDATYVGNKDADDEFVVEFADLPAAASMVSSLSATMRAGNSFAGVDVRQFVRSGANTTYGAWVAPVSITNTVEALACPGGATYTVAVVNALRGGCGSQFGDSFETINAYDIWWDVGWETASGGFALFAAGLHGAAILLSEIPGLVRAMMNRRPQTRFLPSEYRKIWYDIVGCRNPRFVDLGAR